MNYESIHNLRICFLKKKVFRAAQNPSPHPFLYRNLPTEIKMKNKIPPEAQRFARLIYKIDNTISEKEKMPFRLFLR